jgi:hypothetical protein
MEMQIFNAKGALRPIAELEPLVSELDADKRARFEVLRVAAEAVEQAEIELKAAQDAVNTAADDLRSALKYRSDHFPPMTFYELHKATFQNTAERQRKAPPPPQRRAAGSHDPKTSAYEEAKAARSRAPRGPVVSPVAPAKARTRK